MIYSKVDKLMDVLQHQDSWNFLLVHRGTNENEFHLRTPRPMN